MSIKPIYLLSYLILNLLLISFQSSGQVELTRSTIKVLKNNQELTHAFAGGMNSAQFGELDINLDGVLDLILLDRSSDKLTCFLNLNQSYQYTRNYDHLFPNDLEKWMVLADYNCDGKNDLFTYSSLGIRVFENTSTTSLSWKMTVDPILTQVNAEKFNITLNATDIPAIVDMDQDGDLDILHYNFAHGDFIEYHENKSNESSTSCSLDYYRVTTRFGEIETCGCNTFGFEGESCHTSARINHVMGKTLLAFDGDQDSDMDLVVSQDECGRLNFLENTGNATSPVFQSSTTIFPNASNPVDWIGFPAAFYLDVTFDGKSDLVVSQNLRENPDVVNFSESSVIFEQIESHAFANSVPFLQDQMIDVGEYSFPALGDMDGDGLEDLLIGYAGFDVQNQLIGSISWYKYADNGLIFQTDDAFQFSKLGVHHIRPQLIDLNKDQKLDLVFQAISSTNKSVFGYLINSSEQSGLQFEIADVQYIDFPVSSDSDYLIFDWDYDGTLDVMEATYFGELRYFQGSESFGNFSAQAEAIMHVTAQLNEYNLSFSIFDIDQDGSDDLITSRRPGILEIFSDIRHNKTTSIHQLFNVENSTQLLDGRFGKYAKPVGGMLGRKPSLIVGGIQGGIQIFESTFGRSGEPLTLEVYPNPSVTNIFTIDTNQFGCVIEVIDLMGQVHYLSTPLNHTISTNLDLSHLNKGIYLIRLVKGGKCATKKVVVG